MTARAFLDGKVTLHCGDCLDVLDSMDENSVDSVVCDPPYHLTSIVKRFGAEGAAPAKGNPVYGRASAGFMGKQWDGGDVAFRTETWAKVLRVLKPGGYLIAFSGTRTYHRMAVAIEDAGFDIRDQIGWCYGGGFPKSHNISRNLNDWRCSCERPAGADQDLQHDVRRLRGADLSPKEPIGTASREVLLEGLPEQSLSGAMLRAEPEKGAVDGTQPGMEGRGDLSEAARELRLSEVRPMPGASDFDGSQGWVRDGASAGDGRMGRPAPDKSGDGASQRSSAAQQPAVELGALADEPGPQTGGSWPVCGGCGKPIIPDGLGTALKPAWEPICLARKPFAGTNAANVLLWGTGALNIDGCRVGNEVVGWGGGAAGGNTWNETNMGLGKSGDARPVVGRWPANVIHDGSDEVLDAFPSAPGQMADESRTAPSAKTSRIYGAMKRQGGPSQNDPNDGVVGFKMKPGARRLDSGSAARFFYTAKADAEDRLGSKHPTVKPLDLMQYLVRLVTPPGGLVLDPFAGTGTTGEAAWREGMRAILIEREAEYQADIARRMDLAQNPTKRAAVAKSKNNLQGAEGTPLFGGEAA